MKIPEQKMDYYKEPQRAVDVDAGLRTKRSDHHDHYSLTFLRSFLHNMCSIV